MARRRRAPDPSRSPLVELEAELRSLERKRREVIEERDAVRRFEAPTRIAPGSWSDLERSVYLERAA